MKNRVHELFRKKSKGILSIFYTAGFPHIDSTTMIAEALETAGVDMIEIGIPFSDPIADGPTIQESNKVALDNGMNLKLLLQQVRKARTKVNIPIVLMGYLNPVLQYGMESFVRDAAEAGVDGFILPDLPFDVYRDEYKNLFETHNVTNTFLVSPMTAEERIRMIDDLTDSFIYAVSSNSITGAKNDFANGQMQYFEKLRSMKLNNPFLIGFGISNRQTFSTASEFGAGAIIGSAFINLLKTSTDIPSDIKEFIKRIR